MGADVYSLLPAMHVLTGCDSTSSLHGIGKKKAVSILQKHKVELDGLKNFGTNCKVLGDDTVRVSFKFIGFWFGEATLNLNHLRYKIFTKKKKTWTAANFPQQKTVLEIMSNELTTSALSGSMLDIRSCHWSHLLEMNGPRTKWGI